MQRSPTPAPRPAQRSDLSILRRVALAAAPLILSVAGSAQDDYEIAGWGAVVFDTTWNSDVVDVASLDGVTLVLRSDGTLKA